MHLNSHSSTDFEEENVFEIGITCNCSNREQWDKQLEDWSRSSIEHEHSTFW